MKKILNIFASISLITAGASSVVACGSSPPSSNDQKLVNDVINRLKKHKAFGLNENQDGSKTFINYKTEVLQDIKSNLTEQEKSLVSFPSSDNTKTLNAKGWTYIHVDIQSHNIKHEIDINVKLNSDAQSIADILDTKTITVYTPIRGKPDPYSSFTLSPISAYQSQIKDQIQKLLTSKGIKSNYGITFNWNDPYTKLIDNLSWVNNAIIGLTINVGTKDNSMPFYIQVKLEFHSIYTQQKEDIDDPNEGSELYPKQINTAGTTVPPSDWQTDGIKDLLDDSWDFGDFNKYVSYKPTIISNGWEYNKQTKRYQKITNQVKMYCPLLGWTEKNPRYFYVVIKGLN